MRWWRRPRVTARPPTSPTSRRSIGRRPRSATPSPTRGSASTRSRPTTCPAIVTEVAARGFGANVVSRGEWAIARRAGLPNDRITLEGVGKTDADLRDAVRATSAGTRAARLGRPRIGRRGGGGDAPGASRGARHGRPATARRPRPAQPGRPRPRRSPSSRSAPVASKFGMTETEATGARRVARRERRWRAAAARDPPPRRLAAPCGRCLAGRGPSRPRGRRPATRGARNVRHARRRRRTSRSCRSTSRRPVPSASHARFPRCWRRSPRIGARPVSRSSPAGRWWPARAGSSRASSTSANGAVARSSSTRG